MPALAWTTALVALWFLLSVLIDRRNALREGVSAVSFAEIVAVGVLALAGALLAPPSERIAVGLALAGIGIAACGDVRHGYLWEEITVPTLFAVLAASAYAGIAPNAAAGIVALGGIALAIYFGGQLLGKEPGFGDIVPTAIIGAAVGPVPGLAALAIACAGFVIAALILGRRFGIALPFGPAIAAAILIGAAAASWLPAIAGR
ncbi:MAG TPA: hypothetical protein VMW12_04250 [Candidatus Dormibacteraeota bacterium]|nr:hypothetical protein [Candidatus Dormibacteraeota bacterium]